MQINSKNDELNNRYKKWQINFVVNVWCSMLENEVYESKYSRVDQVKFVEDNL